VCFEIFVLFVSAYLSLIFCVFAQSVTHKATASAALAINVMISILFWTDVNISLFILIYFLLFFKRIIITFGIIKYKNIK